MRHRVAVGRKSFGRTHSHKNALLKNLIFALIEHGRIKTTLAKAKELRRHADRLITLGKRGDLNTRRLLLSRYPNKKLIADVFERLVPQFSDRSGGYTRIVKIGNRVGDNAEMAFIEWVVPELITDKQQRKAKPVVKKVKKAKKVVDEPKPVVQEPVVTPEEQEVEKPKRGWWWFWPNLKPSKIKPRTKGLLMAVILVVAFIAVGLFVRSCVQANQVDHSKDVLSQLENMGAYDFCLPRVQDDEFISLSEFRGRITIVNFWATWCEPCVEEFASMLELLDRFQGQVHILAISMDQDKTDILNFLQAFEVNNPYLDVLHDPVGDLAKKWGTVKLPESYILNADQKLVKKVASSENWASPMVFRYFTGLIEATSIFSASQS